MFLMEFPVCLCADFSDIYTDGKLQTEQFENWQDVSVIYIFDLNIHMHMKYNNCNRYIANTLYLWEAQNIILNQKQQCEQISIGKNITRIHHLICIA